MKITTKLSLIAFSSLMGSCATNKILSETGTHSSYTGIKDNLSLNSSTAHVLITHGMGHNPGSLSTFEEQVESINSEIEKQLGSPPIKILGSSKESLVQDYKLLNGKTLKPTTPGMAWKKSVKYAIKTPKGKRTLHYHWVDYSFYLVWQKTSMLNNDRDLWTKSPALANRILKDNIMNWGFSDAVLYTNPKHRKEIQRIFDRALKDISSQRKKDEPVTLIASSLGSIVLMDSFDRNGRRARKTVIPMNQQFMFANQIPLIKLGSNNIDRSAFLKHSQKSKLPFSIVAFSDPSDLLTYKVSKEDLGLENADKLRLTNTFVSNKTWCIPWLLKNPNTHTKYHLNPHVLKRIVGGSSSVKVE